MPARQHRLLAATLSIPLLLGLVACGDDGDDEGTDETEEESSEEGTETTESTETTETTETEGEATDDEAAAGDAVATLFDSSLPFDDKVALVEGGEAHRADHEAYVGAAEGVGGIALEPTDVAVAGDTATVTYRVLFGGNEAYADLSMDITRGDAGWVVPTAEFCGFLSSARTPCAAAA